MGARFFPPQNRTELVQREIGQRPCVKEFMFTCGRKAGVLFTYIYVNISNIIL